MRRTIAVAGPASADQAWARYAVVSCWATWAPPIRRVEASGQRLVPGLIGTVHGPAGIVVRFRTESVDDAARSWSWWAAAGPVRAWLGHEVLARADGGCVATLTLDGPRLVVLLYPAVARLALRRLVT